MAVPYEQYADLFLCTAPRMMRYSNLFYTIAICQTGVVSLLALTTTVLHTVDAFDELGYILGFGATLVSALNSLLPMRAAAVQSAHAAAVMNRHLQTRDSISPKLLYFIAGTDCLWFSHPTSFCIQRHAQPSLMRHARSPSTGTPTTTEATVRHSASPTRAAPTQTSRVQIGCVVLGFDKLAKQFYAIYCGLMFVQLSTITIATMFHVLDADTLRMPESTVSAIGTVFGGVATAIVGLLAIIPVEVSAHQCRDAYAATLEYWISGTPVPPTVLEAVYSASTLWHTNPIYASHCLRPVATAQPTMAVVDSGRPVARFSDGKPASAVVNASRPVAGFSDGKPAIAVVNSSRPVATFGSRNTFLP